MKLVKVFIILEICIHYIFSQYWFFVIYLVLFTFCYVFSVILDDGNKSSVFIIIIGVILLLLSIKKTSFKEVE
jgi:hypothetical protein